jgi:hypothetical protein
LFQFHLSTAIVLMLVASGLLWGNMRPPVTERLPSNEPQILFVHVRWPGWPFAAENMYAISNAEAFGESVSPDEKIKTWVQQQEWGPLGDGSNIAANAVCALLILAGIGVVCEWRIRRQEKQA